MPNEKPPRKRAHWPPRAEDDHLHRHPEPYPLDQPKDKGRNVGWKSIAKDQALETAADLVDYNFHTKNAEEINWYLKHYVGCAVPTPDGQDYTFKDVVYDQAKNRGVIFIPRFGNSSEAHDNDLGNQVIKDYNKSSDKNPGGLCHRTCYARVREASRQLAGKALPEIKWDEKDTLSDFAILWSSHVGDGKRWSTLPKEFRGKGAAGAMAFKGLGTLVDGRGIWEGKLKPGAVIQAWGDAKDHDNVRDGKPGSATGHSFIFLHYVKTRGTITGMVIADQGYQSDTPLKRSDYGFWVGANIK